MANNSQSSYDWFSLSIILILLAILAGFVAYTVMNQSKLSKLQSELEASKQQVADVQQQTEEAKDAVVDEAQDQLNQVANSIANIDNPAVRLQVIKQLQTRLAKVLSPQAAADLNTVVVYIERDPTVLVETNPQLPADISQAVANVKKELVRLKTQAAVATSVNNQQSTAQPDIGQTYTLTGTINFVAQDPVLGGSYFRLTDTNYGEPFYLYLNSATAATVQSTMEGQVVTVQVKITGVADGYVTYDIVSGPTLGSVTMAPTQAAAPTLTKAPTKAVSPTKAATGSSQIMQ